MNCNERTILMKFLLIYDDDVYTRVRPYDLQSAMMINKYIKDISKRDSSLASGDLVCEGVTLPQIRKVGFSTVFMVWITS